MEVLISTQTINSISINVMIPSILISATAFLNTYGPLGHFRQQMEGLKKLQVCVYALHIMVFIDKNFAFQTDSSWNIHKLLFLDCTTIKYRYSSIPNRI